MLNDEVIRRYLEQTIDLAQKGLEKKNYPIGAIIVNSKSVVLAASHNECATKHDITAHAELLCIKNVGLKIDKDDEGDNILFVSLEPCFGCSFFIDRTNIRRIYWALKDPHKGGIGDLKKRSMFRDFFSTIELISEPFEDLKIKSRKLMKNYFLSKGNTKAAKLYD